MENKPSVFKDNRDVKDLLENLKILIEQTKINVAYAVNSSLVIMNWKIGKFLRDTIAHSGDKDYIIPKISEHLSELYGKGFSRSNLFNMLRFVDSFPEFDLVQTLSGHLSWSHFVELIYLENPLKRDFYVEMTRIERWSVRVLKSKIQSMMFERTAIAKKPDKVIRKDIQRLQKSDQLSHDLIFRDPYVLEFLDLEDSYNETEFESAILKSIEKFLLELGTDFTFVARQKRITIDGQDYYIDLVFFHRRLRCLIRLAA